MLYFPYWGLKGGLFKADDKGTLEGACYRLQEPIYISEVFKFHSMELYRFYESYSLFSNIIDSCYQLLWNDYVT